MEDQVKRHWERLAQKAPLSSTEFHDLVEKLIGDSIQEILNLAVIVTQRIFAISQVQSFIENGNNATSLYRLIEKLPWLLGSQWEKLTANEEIKKLCFRAQQSQSLKREDKDHSENIPLENLRSQLNFVFLGGLNGQKKIVVFGLEGTEVGKELNFCEYRQLRGYLDTIQDAKGSISVKGLLIGNRKGNFPLTDTRIEVVTWQEILADARRSYLDYLEALLAFPNAIAAEDKRINTIRNFGDDEVKRLLDKIVFHNNESLKSHSDQSQN